MHIDIIDGKTARKCLSMPQCINLIADVMVSLYQEEALAPQRMRLPLFNRNKYLMIMPGAIKKPAIMGTKTLAIYPENSSIGVPVIQGFITLFDLETGTPLALIDAASITAIRTAAASAVATRILAREDSYTLALLGTGIQAETHLHAMLAVRPINQVKVWGRSLEQAQIFSLRVQRSLNIQVDAVEEASDAVAHADIICTLTSSPNPIIKGDWLKAGAHLNMVGAHTPNTREVDTDLIKRAQLFVELKSSALREAGEILIPLRAHEIEEKHILGEIAQVILGEISGRSSSKDITAYKSLGNSVQDLVIANEALIQARHQNMVNTVEFCTE